MCKLLLISLLISQMSCTILPIIGDYSLVQIAKNAISNTFKMNDCLFIIQNATEQSVIVRAMALLYKPVVLQSIDTYHHNIGHCKGYVFYEEDYLKLERLFTQPLSYTLELRPNTKVLIFYSGRERFYKYLRLNDNLFGSDVIIVDNFINSNYKSTKEVRVISARNSIVLDRVIPEALNLTLKEYLTNPWTPIKPIVAAGFHYPPYVYYSKEKGAYDGIDVMIFREVTKKWKTEFKPYTPAYRIFSYMFNETKERKNDVCLCSPWHGSAPYELYTTTPYTMHCITFLVHKPYIKNKSLLILSLFKLEVWIGLLSSFLLVIAGRRIFAHARSFIISLAVTGGALRFLWICYALCTIIMCTIFSAALSTSMTNPSNVHPPISMEALANQSVRWTARAGIDPMDVFVDAINPVHTQMLSRYDSSMTMKERNRLIRTNKNVPVLVQVLPNGYVKGAETLDQYGWLHLQAMPKCLNNFLVALVLSRGSPLGEVFDEKITRFVEHGLVIHWYNELSLRDKTAKLMENFRWYSNIHNIHEKCLIDLEMLQTVFYFWAIGLAIATFSFAIEIYLSRQNKE